MAGLPRMSEAQCQQEASRWLPYVQAYQQAYQQGARLAGTTVDADGAMVPATHRIGKPLVIVLCSPHPDDEMLTGALPFRLRCEQGARVVNLAVTLGSDPARKAARWQELQAACGVAGFECRRLPQPSGFNLKAGEQGRGWDGMVATLAGIFAELAPDFVFLPHGEDHHPAHLATHGLVSAALAVFTSGGATVMAVETEYWRAMAEPNLLVGLDAHDLAWLVEALACHRGEIERNPYHLTLPPRLMDAVRRGSELVKGMGQDRPGFLFGELYRVACWRQGCGQAAAFDQGWVGPSQGLDTVFTCKELWTSP